VGDYDLDLAELQHHWGSAYIVAHPGADTWIAERRDDHQTLRAESAVELLEKIRANYAAHPVSRHQHGGGGQRPARSRFTVEG
jgi:hypothetical protein